LLCLIEERYDTDVGIGLKKRGVNLNLGLPGLSPGSGFFWGGKQKFGVGGGCDGLRGPSGESPACYIRIQMYDIYIWLYISYGQMPLT
jgi:hypothetical protein